MAEEVPLSGGNVSDDVVRVAATVRKHWTPAAPSVNHLLEYLAERGLMPQFPYYVSGTKAWMFGAPDGYRDGVILVLTSGSDSEKFTEWMG